MPEAWEKVSQAGHELFQGQYRDFATLLGFVLSLWLTRVIILQLLLKLSRSSYAESFRLTKRPLINDKQLERESVWPLGHFIDSLAALLCYFGGLFHNLPTFEGFGMSLLVHFVLHATVVEFVYYWFHRALHFPWLYKNYHQYHHKSINTLPTTALSFEIGERLAYTILFAIAPIGADLLGYQTYAMFFLYFVWFDIMNEGGHINYEAEPTWYNSTPLKWIFYTPAFHAVHHTRFKKNYSLFMPWTDILFGTAVYVGSSSALEEPIPGGQEAV